MMRIMGSRVALLIGLGVVAASQAQTRHAPITGVMGEATPAMSTAGAMAPPQAVAPSSASPGPAAVPSAPVSDAAITERSASTMGDDTLGQWQPRPDIEIGAETRSLLQQQVESRHPGRQVTVSGEAAQLMWQRYLDSFKHPIPETLKTHVEGQNRR